MADITMCDGGPCPLKANCYRFTAPKNPHWQAYFTHIPYDFNENKCDMFSPVEQVSEE